MLTHLTTPVGDELTQDELRAIEKVYGMDEGYLARGIRTGPRDVTVTAHPPPLDKIKISIQI